jgi:hypothetical protein
MGREEANFFVRRLLSKWQGPRLAPEKKVLGEKDFIIRYPLPSNPIINV